MPNTRKKVIKTVYKDEDESDSGAGDFSDSGSDAQIPEQSSSEDGEDAVSDASSRHEFNEKSRKKTSKPRPKPKRKFAKELYQKLSKQSLTADNEDDEVAPTPFTVKDLTEADKLLPSVLNLSESDSSDDETPHSEHKQLEHSTVTAKSLMSATDSEEETNTEYKDVWANNKVEISSEDVAKRTFQELEQHKSKIEEAKASVMRYKSEADNQKETDVTDLLAQGEDLPMEPQESKVLDDSESEVDDWEEVKEAKGIPKQGLQLVLNIPNEACRKTKKLDVEMMMKRKINRVKKEHQVFMHKVHVLCWLGHGNHVSHVLNDQDILAAALSLVPSKECYPGERVDMKYLEQITTWYKDKLTLKQDKNEDKFKPKAPHLKELLLVQIKNRAVTAKKYLVFIFVSLLRALGLQSRVMFNFVTLPLKPPSSELCSLSTKSKEDKDKSNDKKLKHNENKDEPAKNKNSTKKSKQEKVVQVDGNFDDEFSSESSSCYSDYDCNNISQLDGNDDTKSGTANKRRTRNTSLNKNRPEPISNTKDDVSPPKRARKSPIPHSENVSLSENKSKKLNSKCLKNSEPTTKVNKSKKSLSDIEENCTKENLNEILPPKRKKIVSEKKSSQSEFTQQSRTRNAIKSTQSNKTNNLAKSSDITLPKIIITQADDSNTSKYFGDSESISKRVRSKTTKPISAPQKDTKIRARSTPSTSTNTNSEKSKYFENNDSEVNGSEIKVKRSTRRTKKDEISEDNKRVSHRDLLKKFKPSVSNDVTADLVHIIKSRIKDAKENEKKSIVKGKVREESDDDSDFLPEEAPKKRNSDSDDDFKPSKISPKAPRAVPSSSRKKDRRILSSDDDTPKNKIDVWCEVFVEELEQWISVDVVRGKVHCTKEIYNQATHPVCYVVGWDNNNYLKDLTRRYVPHWNTVTRKQRVEASWWDTAIRPWLGPKTGRDKEEDEQLNRMQLEAPLPKSIAEYKNHPLYALKRHLLKFEAIYPPDAATLGFVRNEPVYSRDCVYVCRSRDTWLKEAKVVRLGEQPYKVVKARPKWDKLSNKLITDKPLEVFGPWQVQDYEPPVAENGIVPRNAYGNVELFKDCMLPKGTVHIKLPGLNRIAKKLNIDCAPAMTGFEFNGGWSHPVYDGFVVCKEYGEIITEAWLKDQEEQERKEREKLEARIYGNWRKLIKGLLIKERLKNRYGFEEPEESTSKNTKKSKGPRLVVKKKN